jgi:hypothetical protein
MGTDPLNFLDIRIAGGILPLQRYKACLLDVEKPVTARQFLRFVWWAPEPSIRTARNDPSQNAASAALILWFLFKNRVAD